MLSLEQELEASPSLDQMLDPEPRHTHEGCSLTSWIQGILYHFVAKPVVKARYFIIGKPTGQRLSILMKNNNHHRRWGGRLL